MDVLADIAPFPGTAASNESVAGGIALGLSTSTSADLALFYRYSSQLLEIRNTAIPAPELPEALATLSTTQLQSDYSEELEISLVTSAVLSDTVHFLVYVRDAASATGKLFVFNPFSLAIYLVPVALPNNVCSLGVSVPFLAGSGTTTEWEFAVVCFGMPGGDVLIGSLTVGPEGSQITAIEASSIGACAGNITQVCIQALPKTAGRALAFLGTSDGRIAALEYSAFGTSRAKLVETISSKLSPSPIALMSCLPLDDDRIVLCAGHNPSTRDASVAATVSAFLVSMSISERSELHVAASQIGCSELQFLHCDEDSDALESDAWLLANASIVDLAMFDLRSAADSTGAPQGIFVSSLANASSPSSKDDKHPRNFGPRSLGPSSSATCGITCTWLIEAESLELVGSATRVTSPPERMLGMRITGRSAQIEVVTDKHILICDAIDDAYNNESGCGCGIGLPLDTSRYIEAGGRFAYQPHIRNALAEQRRRMDGELFIDLLLRMAGIAGMGSASAYPPRTPAEQRTLVERIGASELDDLKQNCILYYLLLDLSAEPLVSAHGSYIEAADESAIESSVAFEYAHDMLIPRHFEYLMRGYWLMDHGQTSVGVSYLADPSVIADWAPKILRTTVASGLYNEARHLLSSVTAMMQPKLGMQSEEPSVIMDVLLHCDIGEAFAFQRQKASVPELRDTLLAQLFALSLSQNVRRSVIDRLSTLPFDSDEEAALEAHCLSPDTPTHAKDFLALYYVNRGRYVEAIRVFQDIANSEKEEGRPSSAIQIKKHNERAAMVKNLIMLLPIAQRCMIDELESSPAAEPPAVHGEPATMDIDTATDGGAASSISNAGSSEPARISPTAPLSASKASRQLRPMVGVQGAQHGPSHALMRVLMKQMVAAKPVCSSLSSSSSTAGGTAAPPTIRTDSSRAADTASTQASANTLKHKGTTVSTDRQGLFSEADPEDNPRAMQPKTPVSKATATATPWKTPMTSFVNRTKYGADAFQNKSPLAETAAALTPTIQSPLSHGSPRSSVRVPFSGPPSTPRQNRSAASETPSKVATSADAGQTPGRGILPKAPSSTDTPLISKKVPGGFPLAGNASRSPFERAKHKSLAQLQKSNKEIGDVRQTGHGNSDTARKILENSVQRYNLRQRGPPSVLELNSKMDSSTAELELMPALTEELDTGPSHPAAAPTAASSKREFPGSFPKSSMQQKAVHSSKSAKSSKSHSSKKKKKSDSSRRTAAASGKKSARSFERAIGNTAAPEPSSSRTRKRA
ncbi:hypothetical protein GGI12_002915 [Dipsacomyces acuminosporus]|nr:hypothetical protein GGI12_002915 [Dipsacomyces acuminosporus]